LVGSIFHMARKIVSEMTYNVSMGTLNPTIPYHNWEVGMLCGMTLVQFASTDNGIQCDGNLPTVATRERLGCKSIIITNALFVYNAFSNTDTLQFVTVKRKIKYARSLSRKPAMNQST